MVSKREEHEERKSGLTLEGTFNQQSSSLTESKERGF
jgi:hypothetical protein